jgi:FixJ family two-component response regulator
MSVSHARRIHIVHSDVRTRRRLHAQLVSLGYGARSFADGEGFIAGGLPECPDCLVLDCDLPDDGAPSLQLVAQHGDACVPVVFVADDADVGTAVRAMKAGAVDFLELPVPDEQLAEAVARATVLADAWRAEAARCARAHALVARLTPRERAVFELLLEGRLNKQIAGALDSREATVKVHRSRLIRKLEVRSLAELLDLGRQLEQDSVRVAMRMQGMAAATPRVGAEGRGVGDVARGTAPGGRRLFAEQSA